MPAGKGQGKLRSVSSPADQGRENTEATRAAHRILRSAVGFGDITAVSQPARLVVTAQMLLDLLALGLGMRVFVEAVRLARQALPDSAGPVTSPDQARQQRGQDSA